MSTSTPLIIDWVDTRLTRRILELIIEGTMRQIDKTLDLEDPAEAFLELWRAQKLTLPFDRLPSRSQLLRDVSTPQHLFDTDIDDAWDDDAVEIALQLIIERELVYELILDRSRFSETSRLLALPLALLVYNRMKEWHSRGCITIQEFDSLVERCHPEHSRFTLAAFRKKIDVRAQRSLNLDAFNIALALFLLMYGAVRKERALRIQVDPMRNITNYQEIIGKELTRIGLKVLGRDPMIKGTLLDHIQASDKIGRVLENPRLYVRRGIPLSNGGTEYILYFDLGVEDITHGRFQQRLDRVLRSILGNATRRNVAALANTVGLFKEHVHTSSFVMKPVHIKTLFGDSPSIGYLMALHERAEYWMTQLEEGEERSDDDDGLQP